MTTIKHKNNFPTYVSNGTRFLVRNPLRLDGKKNVPKKGMDSAKTPDEQKIAEWVHRNLTHRPAEKIYLVWWHGQYGCDDKTVLVEMIVRAYRDYCYKYTLFNIKQKQSPEYIKWIELEKEEETLEKRLKQVKSALKKAEAIKTKKQHLLYKEIGITGNYLQPFEVLFPKD